jgi:hypothetical protein
MSDGASVGRGRGAGGGGGGPGKILLWVALDRDIPVSLKFRMEYRFRSYEQGYSCV